MADLVYADGGNNSPGAGGIGWVDFSTLLVPLNNVIDPNHIVQNISVKFRDNSTLTFSIRNSPISLGGRSFEASTVPISTTASFGNTGYTNISAKPILYETSDSSGAGKISQLRIFNIQVKDTDGNIVPNYTMVIANAGQTNIGQTIECNSADSVWNLLIDLPSTGGAATTSPVTAGISSKKVTETGIDNVTGTSGPIITTLNPTDVSIKFTSSPQGDGGRQAIAIGFAITKISLVKNLLGRRERGDQFKLSIEGTPNGTITTTGNLYGIQNESINIFGIPENVYKINEVLVSNGWSTIVDYKKTVEFENLSPGGSTQPSSFIPQEITLKLGDIIKYTITNTLWNPVPFVCAPKGYRVSSSGGNSMLVEIDLLTGNKRVISNDVGVNIDVIGYNCVGNLIYGIRNNSTNVVVMDSLGNTNDLGEVPNLPMIPGRPFNEGAVDWSGCLYIRNNQTDRFFVVDVNQYSPNFMKLVDSTQGLNLDTPPYGVQLDSIAKTDAWTIRTTDGYLYGIDGNKLIVVDPYTGNTNTIDISGMPVNETCSVMYSVDDGFVYAEVNSTGHIYRIEVNDTNNTTSATYFSTDAPSENSDGASCVRAEMFIDFGDAPDISEANGAGNYNTRLRSNGPRHAVREGLTLGTKITSEGDAHQSPDALGDDKSRAAQIQDDGLILPLPILLTTDKTYSLEVRVVNETTDDANLYGWLDFNKDGLFNGNEAAPAQVVQSQQGVQNITLNFNVPNGVSLSEGETFVRLRLTTDNLVNKNSDLSAEDTRSLGAVIDGEVEDYLLNIAKISIAVIKEVNFEVANKEDTIVYEVIMRNDGTIPVKDVEFKDELPPGTVYNDNLFVSTGYTGTTPMDGLIINNIDVDQIVTMRWQVVLNGNIPNPNPINNSAIITIPGVGEEHTNLTETTILETTELVDKSYADIGDIITYTVTIENPGETSCYNVDFQSYIPEGTTYEGNLRVNSDYTGEDPAHGLIINEIHPGDTATISWDVKIQDTAPLENPIENFSIENIDGGMESPTNIVATRIQTADLTSPENFINEVDKDYAFPGDVLTYTLTIKNTGNVPADNLKISDQIQSGAEFLPNSITSSIRFSGADIENGIILQDPLAAGDTAIITFEVKIDESLAENHIADTAHIEYTYTVDPVELRVVSKEGNSNEVETIVSYEEKQIQECLFILEKDTEIQSINVAQSAVSITTINERVDRSKLIYKKDPHLNITYAVYNLYVDINVNYIIKYNDIEDEEFNRMHTILMSIPVDRADQKFIEAAIAKNTQYFISGSRKCFFVITKVAIVIKKDS